MSAPPITARSARPPLLRLVAVEWRKMLDTRASLWLVGLTALAVLAAVVGQALAATGADAEAGSIFLTACGISSLLLPIVAILLVTSEWSQRSGLITFALVPQRPRVIVAKAGAALLLVAASVAIWLLAALLSGAALGSGAEIESTEIGQASLYLLIGVAIGFSLGLLFMNSPLAIVLLFAAPIAFGIVGAISPSINDVTVWIDQSALEDLITSDSDLDGTVEWDKVATNALFWIALPLTLGLARLRQTDID